MVISSIVEGHGEVGALPVLLRRLADWRSPGAAVNILKPIRVHRDRFLNRPEEFSRHLKLARDKSGRNGWVLILLDADDDCPATLSQSILRQAMAQSLSAQVSVVLANREFESWYIGSGRALDGSRSLHLTDSDLLVDAEVPRDAKGWLSRRMAHRYSETTDQPAFAFRMSLDETHGRCRSFRKLCDEWDRNIAPSRTP